MVDRKMPALPEGEGKQGGSVPVLHWCINQPQEVFLSPS